MKFQCYTSKCRTLWIVKDHSLSRKICSRILHDSNSVEDIRRYQFIFSVIHLVVIDLIKSSKCVFSDGFANACEFFVRFFYHENLPIVGKSTPLSFFVRIIYLRNTVGYMTPLVIAGHGHMVNSTRKSIKLNCNNSRSRLEVITVLQLEIQVV